MKSIFLVTDSTSVAMRRTMAELSRAMAGGKEPVTVVCSGDEDLHAAFAAPGIDFVRAYLGGVFDIISPIKISRRLEESDRAAIILSDMSAIVAATRAKELAKARKATVKTVFIASGVLPDKLSPEERRRLREDIDCIIFPFHSARERFVAAFPDAVSRRMSVVFPGVPSPALPPGMGKISDNSPQAPLSGSGEEKDPLRMIFTGEIYPARGLDNLIALLELLSPLPCRLTVVGTGQGRYVMPILRHSRSAEVDPSVDWAGDDPRVSERLSRAEVGIIPSAAPCDDYIPLLGMLAAGLPVIASDKGYGSDIKQILSSGEARLILVRGNSAEALSEGIKQYLTMKKAAENQLPHRTPSLPEPFLFERFLSNFRSEVLSLFSNQ